MAAPKLSAVEADARALGQTIDRAQLFEHLPALRAQVDKQKRQIVATVMKRIRDGQKEGYPLDPDFAVQMWMEMFVTDKLIVGLSGQCAELET